MLEKLNRIDGEIVLWIDGQHSAALDFFFYWLSCKWTMVPVYFLLLVLIIKNYGRSSWFILLSVFILILLTDQLSSVIKDHVMRLRPCHDAVIAARLHLVNGECGGNYGFISSHAANTFALVYFLTNLFGKNYRKINTALIIWASLASFSRIYLGAHYLSDVVAGAVAGLMVSFVIVKIFNKCFPLFYQKEISIH